MDLYNSPLAYCNFVSTSPESFCEASKKTIFLRVQGPLLLPKDYSKSAHCMSSNPNRRSSSLNLALQNLRRKSSLCSRVSEHGVLKYTGP